MIGVLGQSLDGFHVSIECGVQIAHALQCLAQIVVGTGEFGGLEKRMASW